MEASAENDAGNISTQHTYVRLHHVKTQLWIGAANVSEYAILPSCARPKPNTRDRIVLRHAPMLLEQQMFFLMSQMNFLRQYVEHFHELQNSAAIPRLMDDEETQSIVERAEEALSGLLSFCASRKANTQTDAAVGVGAEHSKSSYAVSHAAAKKLMPIAERQRMLVELSVPQLAIDTFVAPFHDKQLPTLVPLVGGPIRIFEGSTDRQLQPIMNVGKLCFVLLGLIVRGSSSHSQLMFQWLDFLLYVEQFGCGAAELIESILSSGADCLDAARRIRLAEQLLELNAKSHRAVFVRCFALLCASATNAMHLEGFPVQLFNRFSDAVVIMRVEVGRVTVAMGAQSGNQAVPLDLFISHGEANDVTYFAAFLEVLLALSRAGCTVCREFVEMCASRECILVLLQSSMSDGKDGDTTDLIRATSSRIAAELFVRQDLNIVSRCRSLVVLPKGKQQAPEASGVHGDGSFVRQMKSFSLDFVKSHTVMVADCEGCNWQICHCVAMWHLFIKARIASRTEMLELIPAVLAILDGSTDVATRMTTAGEHWCRYDLTRENEIMFRAKAEVCSLLETYLTIIVDDTVKSVSQAVAAGSPATEIYESAQKTLDDHLATIDLNHTLTVLLDVAQYHSAELVRAATSMIALLCNVRRSVVSGVSALLVLDEDETEEFQRLERLVNTLRSCSGDAARNPAVISAIREIVDMLRQSEEAAAERRMAKLGGGDANAPKAARKLQSYGLLRAWDVHETVMNLLPSPKADEEYSTCIEFLVRFSAMPSNAALLASRWPVFFDALEKYPQHEGLLLSLLSQLWPKGNIACPVKKQDIRTVAKLISKEVQPKGVEALNSLVCEGVPRQSNQKEIVLSLIDFHVFDDGWWKRYGTATVQALVSLLTHCCSGSVYVRSLIQKRLAYGPVLDLLRTATLSSVEFKTTLLRFLTGVHFCERGDDSRLTASQFMRALMHDDLWWRIVRDDFLVRFDEALTGHLQNPLVRAYMIECALCLEAFFSHCFDVTLLVKLEWVMKELQGTLSSVCHLVQSLSTLGFAEDEQYVLHLLGASTLKALGCLSDPLVQKLQAALEGTTVKHLSAASKLEPDNSAEPASEYASPVHSFSFSPQETVLQAVIAYFEEGAKTHGDLVEQMVSLMRPDSAQDVASPRMSILSKLLSSIAAQEFDTTTTTTLLQILQKCVEAKEDERTEMQVLLDLIGGMKAATILLDAIDGRIVKESLRFGIALLEGGNTVVQSNFLSYLETNEERFFIGIKRVIEKAALELTHYRRVSIHSSSMIGKKFNLMFSSNAFSYILDLLRLIQLFCEGHHLGMQEYIRVQHDNLRSVNTVQCVLTFLRTILGGVTSELGPILLQCFELLTELCQGPCIGNQSMLIFSDLPHLVRTVLESTTLAFDIKLSATTTMLALVEGCTDRQAVDLILKQLPLACLERVFCGKAVQDDSFVEMIFSIGIFLRELADLSMGTPHHKSICAVLHRRPDIVKLTGRIYIKREERMELVYFRIPDMCTRIREDSKRRLLWAIDRTSQASKLASFYELTDDLILELELTARLTRLVETLAARFIPRLAPYVVPLFNPSAEFWQYASCLVACVANVMFFVDAEAQMPFMWVGLGVVQLYVCLVIMFIQWEIFASVHWYKTQKAILRRNRTHLSVGSSFESDIGTARPRWVPDKYAVPLQSIITKATRPQTIASVIMLLASWQSIFVSHYYLSAHLLWIIGLSTALENVLAAVLLNKRTLLLTMFLGALFAYQFSVVGHAVFQSDFDTDSDSISDNCSSLWHCFLFIIVTGLRQGGGVGDVMRPVRYGSSHFYWRLLFDFAFFTMMIVIFLNILFGIIIDTFAELRDEKHQKEEDMRLKCMVCGTDSHLFDQLGDGFHSHIKNEHSMWHYVYFMHHLRLKDPNNYTGQESYVAKLLERKDFSFFPDRSASLEAKLAKIRGSTSDKAGASSANDRRPTATQPASKVAVPVGERRKRTGSPYSSRPGSPPPELADEGWKRLGRSSMANRDAATQSTFEESVTALQFEIVATKNDAKQRASEGESLKKALKQQTEEIWHLRHQVQISQDVSRQLRESQDAHHKLQRQADEATIERESLSRKNAFLEKEIDHLVLECAQLHAGQRVQHARGIAQSFLEDGLSRRLQMMEAMQLPCTPGELSRYAETPRSPESLIHTTPPCQGDTIKTD